MLISELAKFCFLEQIGKKIGFDEVCCCLKSTRRIDGWRGRLRADALLA